MAFISPVYAIVLPCLFLFTIPVAIFASITSILAFAVLAFRVTLIYIELAVAVVPHYLFGDRSPPVPLPRSKSFIDPVTRVRRRKRRSSSSNQSAGTITPTLGDVGFGISQSVGPTRDYEGVGGWRLDNPSDDDGLWTSFHTRLELPADHGRRHRRTQTSGSAPLVRKLNRSSSPEALMMHSPNTSRARTSPPVITSGTSYFPAQPLSPRIAKKPPSLHTCTSASSESSRSSGLNMKRV